ncbi:prepilin peptidase [Candidatus Saccharibacteria bacterium]|nr:prepilin peptidase [Candidatus Saccharibacteria bacterium]
MNEMWLIVIVGFLGLVFGSFINALVWRLSQVLDKNGDPKKLSAKKKKELSIVSARSMCPSCKHQLSAPDLVPVFSWLFLKGKCRYCKKPISAQYPLVELITAGLFALSAYAWNFDQTWMVASFITWLICLVGLVALAVYDAKTMLLPDKIIFKLYLVAIAGLIIEFLLGRPPADILQIAGSVFVSGGIFYILYQVSQGKWLGGGDVKLGLLIGLLLPNALQGALMLFLASILGTITSIFLSVNKKIERSTKIAFGPFLIASTIIVVLYGQSIIDWYLNIIVYGV